MAYDLHFHYRISEAYETLARMMSLLAYVHSTLFFSEPCSFMLLSAQDGTFVARSTLRRSPKGDR